MRKYVIDFGNQQITAATKMQVQDSFTRAIKDRKRLVLVLSGGIKLSTIETDDPKRAKKRNRNQ